MPRWHPSVRPDAARGDMRVVALRGFSAPTVWSLARKGSLPAPMRITAGKTPRRVGAVRKWLGTEHLAAPRSEGFVYVLRLSIPAADASILAVTMPESQSRRYRMVDMALIQGTLTGLKTAGDMARGFLELKSMSEVQGKVIDLQSTILAAQASAMAALTAQTTLADENRQLKEELTNARGWEEQRARYQLVAPMRGCVVYALRASHKGDEPPHWLCTQCFVDGKKTLLNPASNANDFCSYVCPRCKSSVPTGLRSTTPAKYAEEYAERPAE